MKLYGILCDVYDRPSDHAKIQKEQNEILETVEIDLRSGGYKWRNIFKQDEV